VLLAGAIILALFVLSPALGIAVVAVAAVVEVAELLFWRRFLRRYRVSTGAEGLVGERVEVVEACDPAGKVRLRGELWNAHSTHSLGVGERAQVMTVTGLTLQIAPVDG
jgi:membrane-bound serine protease (ClpP class)